MFENLSSSYKSGDKISNSKSSLVVLDPQWLTKVMAQVITTKKLFVQNGIMEHKHLGFTWKAPEFPSFLHAPLLSLLQSFEVLFRLEGGSDPLSGKSLIPVLLPTRGSEDILRTSKPAELRNQKKEKKKLRNDSSLFLTVIPSILGDISNLSFCLLDSLLD